MNLHEQMAVRAKGKAYAKVLRLDRGPKEARVRGAMRGELLRR